MYFQQLKLRHKSHFPWVILQWNKEENNLWKFSWLQMRRRRHIHKFEMPVILQQPHEYRMNSNMSTPTVSQHKNIPLQHSSSKSQLLQTITQVATSSQAAIIYAKGQTKGIIWVLLHSCAHQVRSFNMCFKYSCQENKSVFTRKYFQLNYIFHIHIGSLSHTHCSFIRVSVWLF